MKRKISIIVTVFIMMLCFTLVFANALDEVPSGQLSVQYDDGTGALFKTLPANYAKLNKLNLGSAVLVSGTGYSIVNGQTGSSDKVTRPHLVWTGKLAYGGDLRSTTSNSVLKSNSLPAAILKFPNSAELSDGKKADVIVVLDHITVNVTKSLNDKITSSTNVRVMLAASDNRGLWLVTASPKTAIDRWDYTNENKSTSAGTAHRLRTTIRLTEHADGKTIGRAISTQEYPSMLVEFKDLDVRDFSIRKGATYTQLWNGPYAEGIEMTTGWGNPVALAPMGTGILNQSLVEKQFINGNTKIKGKGSQFQALNGVTGNPNDTESFYSGFAAPVSPAGFSFYWTGSVTGGKNTYANMGTVISGQPTVEVKAMRSEGGSLGNTETGVSSGLNTWKSNTHLMNSAATYCFAPEEGWMVKYLKVDDEEIELSQEERLQGGEYVFERLNKNPVVRRTWRDGAILDAEESSTYKIEVKYVRRPEYETEKVSDRSEIRSMSTEPVTYTIRCKEKYAEAGAGAHQIKDDIGGGALSIVPDSIHVTASEGSTFTIDKQDQEGLWVTFNSPEANGDQPELTITYKATVDWTKCSGGEIINTAEDTNTLKIVNNIVIAKKVKGKLRDTTKQFEFEVMLSGLEQGREYQVNLSGGAAIRNVLSGTSTSNGFIPDNDGKADIEIGMKAEQTAAFLNIPVTAGYIVKERSSDHIASYVQSSDQDGPIFIKESDENTSSGKELSLQQETLDLDDGEVSVIFTNSRDPVPVTGLITKTDFLIPGAVIVLTAVVMTVAISRKRKGQVLR
ncbi:MAG: hypothetical protein IJH43_07140 [Mogibacterium sp.]|nr:hypothetical protein [Mogibacterium sp.]